MSRKSLIICLAVLAAMILGVGVAVAVLYSDSDKTKTERRSAVPDQERYMLLPAIPADAVLVACMSDMKDLSSSAFSGFPFTAALADSVSSGGFRSIVSSRIAMSMHFSGKLQTLYVFDVGKASSDPSADASSLAAFARKHGLSATYVDCSEITDGSRDISKRALVVASASEDLVKSSVRHLEKSISVMDAAGFPAASAISDSPDVVFFSNLHAKMLMTEIFTKNVASHHPFISSLAEWTVADIVKTDDTGTYIQAAAVYDNDPSDFMTVLSESEPAVSKVSQMLPSYTLSAVSLPMRKSEPYITAYQAYMDSKQSLQPFRKKQRALESKAGINPQDFVRRLDVKEVAKATFMCGSELASVNLIRVGRQDTLIFVGTQNKSFKDYVPAIHSWPYASFIASVFGGLFELEDESCFTYMNGWIVSGSLDAVEEYVEGRALEYDLVQYMADSGQKDMLSQSEASLVAYFPLTENKGRYGNIFSKALVPGVGAVCGDCDYCPAVLAVTESKSGEMISLQIPRLTRMRTRAPEHERDTVVVIPQGPFRVKNSGTGKMNLFYQNQHGSLCLQEEGGKGLWGVPFDGKLCGTAHNVDYYANGKLQILFGAGKKVYLIDRLGRFVTGFPVELDKEILVGPDVYDFNGTRAYNIMVLHKDNTIDMYNLKGRKPSSWKSITAPETIKALPERIVVGGSTFWVVRTSIQTLIYPFSGGSALTSFKGDQMILPDSEIRIADAASVNVDCYDGTSRTVKLK